MKLTIKKPMRGTVLLFLSFVVISACCITIASSVRVNAENKLYSRDFYSQISKKMTIDSVSDSNIWPDFFAQCKQNDFIIYNPIWDNNLDIRSVYIKGNVETPPMISGRFFTNKDVSGHSKTAVIGKNQTQNTITKNGVAYFVYRNVEYQVIGTMGTPKDSTINSMVFLDFYSGIELNTVNTNYVADSRSSGTLDSLLSDLNKFVAGKNGNLDVSRDDTSTGIDRLFAEQDISQLLYEMMLFCFLLSTMIIAMLWISYRKKSVAVKRMLGHSSARITLDLFKAYLVTAAAAYCVSLLCVLVIQSVNKELVALPQDFALSAGITVLFGALSFLGPLTRILKTNVCEVMK